MTQTTTLIRTVAIAALLALGLGLYAYFGVEKADRVTAGEEATAQKLLSFEAPGEASRRLADGGQALPSLLSISLKSATETAVLERESPEAPWRLTAPVAAQADKLVVEELVNQLLQARAKSLVEEKPEPTSLAKYGLEPPQLLISVEAILPGSTERRRALLRAGLENPFDGSVYVQKEGSPQVFTAPGAFRFALSRSSYELRHKQLVDVEPSRVSAIEAKGRANAFRVERATDGSWQMTSPRELRADTPRIQALLASLRNERALAFPQDSSAQRAAAGFEDPQLDVLLTLSSDGKSAGKTAEKGEATAAGERLRLLFSSARTDAGTHFSVLVERGGSVVLAEVASSAAQIFDRPATELRDRSVLAFQKDDAASLVFRLADGQELVLEKVAADADAGIEMGWRVAAPEPGPARKWKVSGLLWTLASLSASAFGPEEPKDWSKYGIGPKARSVRILDAAGAELAQLQLGKDVPGKSGVLYVRGTGNQVLEVDASRLAELPATPRDLLDGPTDGG